MWYESRSSMEWEWWGWTSSCITTFMDRGWAIFTTFAVQRCSAYACHYDSRLPRPSLSCPAPMNYARRDDASLMANADGAPMCTRKRRQVKLLCNFFTVICEITTSVTKPVMNAIPRPRTAEENPYWLPPENEPTLRKTIFFCPGSALSRKGVHYSFRYRLGTAEAGGWHHLPRRQASIVVKIQTIFRALEVVPPRKGPKLKPRTGIHCAGARRTRSKWENVIKTSATVTRRKRHKKNKSIFSAVWPIISKFNRARRAIIFHFCTTFQRDTSKLGSNVILVFILSGIRKNQKLHEILTARSYSRKTFSFKAQVMNTVQWLRELKRAKQRATVFSDAVQSMWRARTN